jgi:hypothetical protein
MKQIHAMSLHSISYDMSHYTRDKTFYGNSLDLHVYKYLSHLFNWQSLSAVKISKLVNISGRCNVSYQSTFWHVHINVKIIQKF